MKNVHLVKANLVKARNIKVGKKYYVLVGGRVVPVKVLEEVRETVHPLTLVYQPPYERSLYKLKNLISGKVLINLRTYDKIFSLARPRTIQDV